MPKSNDGPLSKPDSDRTGASGTSTASRADKLLVFQIFALTTSCCRLLLGAIALLAPLNLRPQPVTPAAPNPAPVANQVGTPNACVDYRDVVAVTEAYNLRFGDSDKRDANNILRRRQAGLNDIIIIKVRNLEALLEKAKCKDPCARPQCEEQEIALFLNGRVIKGLLPESGAPILEEVDKATIPAATATVADSTFHDGILRYHLQRGGTSDHDRADNEEHWADLLGLNSDPRDWNFVEPVEVSVGLANDYPIRTEVKTGRTLRSTDKDRREFYLVRIRSARLPFWGFLIVGFGGFLIWLASTRSLLTDRAPVLFGQRKPYSLSAVQAAWWFLLILVSFLSIWLVTGQHDFSPTALVLLSLSFGTALGGTVIDANKRGGMSSAAVNSDELNLLLSDKERLETELTELNKKTRAPNYETLFKEKMRLYTAKISEINEKFPSAIGPAHVNFVFDILSDAHGISFHRFQMLVWNVLLGIFFVLSALGKLAMPDFSTTLLALMGISAGTYLGFKIPEISMVPTQPVASPKDLSRDPAGVRKADSGKATPNDQVTKLAKNPEMVSTDEISEGSDERSE